MPCIFFKPASLYEFCKKPWGIANILRQSENIWMAQEGGNYKHKLLCLWPNITERSRTKENGAGTNSNVWKLISCFPPPALKKTCFLSQLRRSWYIKSSIPESGFFPPPEYYGIWKLLFFRHSFSNNVVRFSSTHDGLPAETAFLLSAYD